eukprot:917529-Pyramimonas_sp.AAC.1
MCHRPPPRTVLGGATCLSEIDSSGYATSLGGFGRLANEEMGSWFGFDLALTLEDWGLDLHRVHLL